ncbi:glycosyltransferase [Erythrobacter sp. NE805]|uniref:glycosyltransferase n=1 Tax=Erythrobacter sp. NE805 TaxID=3389875 RepID=UPI00396AF0BE
MIFASIGSMLPFDRFVRAVDEWARDNPGEEVFIQIGEGAYEPVHAPFARMVPMSEYRKRLKDCDLFVAHVGMGSILQALEARKQMLLIPRDIALGEHTTDHQVHTARRFQGRQGMKIVESTEALKAEMTALLREPMKVDGSDFSIKASPQLLDAVATFLKGGTPTPISKAG